MSIFHFKLSFQPDFLVLNWYSFQIVKYLYIQLEDYGLHILTLHMPRKISIALPL